METPDKELFDKVVKISQSRGFVFNASSIYGGLRSSYDYGPLGALLKQNISNLWWKSIKNAHFLKWKKIAFKIEKKQKEILKKNINKIKNRNFSKEIPILGAGIGEFLLKNIFKKKNYFSFN